MDMGEIFKSAFRVIPGQDGSFIISDETRESAFIGRRWGFSNINDLLIWFSQNADAYKKHLRDEKSDQ